MAQTSRVAHVLPWRAIGGTELATLRIALAVADRGFQSVMFCRGDAPLVARFFEDRGFVVERFDATALEGGPLARTRERLRVARRFRDLAIDIVHCADVYAGDLAAVAAKLALRRLVCHVRNRYEWLSRHQRMWLFFVDRVVFVSRETGDVFGRLARGSKRSLGDRGVVLYDGLPPSEAEVVADPTTLRQQLGIADDAAIVGMVARISVQKDHLTLVRAAELVGLVHPETVFLLVGDDGSAGGAEPEHARRVFDAIAASRTPRRFVCTGHRDDVPDLIALMDLFVLCTHREGLPLVLLEAMAKSKPIVATAVDGIPEIVVDGSTGLLHAHGDAEGLARRIVALLDDPVEAERLGDGGRRFLAERFGAEAFARNLFDLYAGLLGSDRVAADARPALTGRDA